MCRNTQQRPPPSVLNKEDIFIASAMALTVNTDVDTIDRAIWLVHQLIEMTERAPLGSPMWIGGANFLAAMSGTEVTALAMTLIETFNLL
jgi:hypothetical protein